MSAENGRTQVRWDTVCGQYQIDALEVGTDDYVKLHHGMASSVMLEHKLISSDRIYLITVNSDF